MDNSSIRNEVWQRLLETCQFARYYRRLSDRTRRYHTIIRLVLLTVAVAGAGTHVNSGLDPGANWPQLLLAVIIIAAIVFEFVYDFGKKAQVLHVIALECNRMQNAYRRLWVELSQGNGPALDIPQQIRALTDNFEQVSGWAGLVGVSEEANLLEQCKEFAEAELKERYMGSKTLEAPKSTKLP